jgi:hypothetical protein
MFIPSKETRRSEVPQILEKASTAPGSWRASQTNFSCEMEYPWYIPPLAVLAGSTSDEEDNSLHVCWEMLFSPCAWVVAAKSESESLEPFGHLLDVSGSIFGADGILDNGETILEEVVSPVAMLLMDIRTDCVRHV